VPSATVKLRLRNNVRPPRTQSRLISSNIVQQSSLLGVETASAILSNRIAVSKVKGREARESAVTGYWDRGRLARTAPQARSLLSSSSEDFFCASRSLRAGTPEIPVGTMSG
jgi:hypothetical protein